MSVSFRWVCLLLVVGSLAACRSDVDPPPSDPVETLDTLARYPDGVAKTIAVRRGDSVVARRLYRPTGALFRVEQGDSVAKYLDLHDLDSSAVLRDYVQGTWRNTTVDATRPDASLYYVFEGSTLTFRNPTGDTIESIDVSYDDYRTLVTQDGMPVTADVASFDTMQVTGYTLIRESDAPE